MHRIPFLLCVFFAFSHSLTADEVRTATRPSWKTSKVTGSPLPTPPLKTVRRYPKLSFKQPLYIQRDPALERMWVATRDGRVFSFPDRQDVSEADLFVDLKAAFSELTPHTSASMVNNVYGLAFHPKYPAIPVCWVTYTLKSANRQEHLEDGTRLVRFNVKFDDQGVPRCDVRSEKILLSWLEGGHNGACLCFGPDGCLYISAGDGEVPNPPDPRKAGQDVTNLLSTVMRINVNPTDNGPLYTVPDDNPFARKVNAVVTPSSPEDLRYTASEARPEIFAYGFRNPWKMNFGPDGQLWVGDVGWELYEMVYNVKPGGNYGWSVFEGPNTVVPDRKQGPTSIVPAALSYSHSEGSSITGGFVYQGNLFQELKGKYIFGDYDTRRIWSAAITPNANGQSDSLTKLTDLVAPSVRVVAFGEDTSNELLILHFDEGTIYGLERNETSSDPSEFPTYLSQTGLFQNVATQQPSEGVLPFEINEPMWHDGAVARRFVGLPGTDAVNALPKATRMKKSSLREKMQFPVDSVLARTVKLKDDTGESIHLETQILHFNGRIWNPYTYIWNTEQTDAQLAPADGAEIALGDYGTFAEQKLWNVHSRSECLRCHNAWVGGALAFTIPQLNRSASQRDLPQSSSAGTNQITHYRDIGLLTGHLPKNPATTTDPTAGPLASSVDQAANIADRARAYLSVNCAHCHQNGAGGTATIDLRHEIGVTAMKTIAAAPAQGTFQIPGASIIAPGAPLNSVLLYRLACSGRGRMPHIGSSLVDTRGVELIRNWIASMPQTSKKKAASLEPSLDTTVGALQLVFDIEHDRIHGSKRDDILRNARNAAPEIRNLFTRFQPLEYRQLTRSRLNANEILTINGDSERGATLFAGKSLQCANCHRVGGKGGQIGPALDDVGTRLSPAAILESILSPSKKIDPKYAAWTAVTANGKVHSGLLVDRSDMSVTLRTVKNENITISRDDLDELIKQTVSLMPDKLLNQLSDQQIADIISYLNALKGG